MDEPRTTSLPVPDSPVISTVVSVAATWVASRSTPRHSTDSPTMGRWVPAVGWLSPCGTTASIRWARSWWISWSVFAIASIVIALPVSGAIVGHSQPLPQPPFGRIHALNNRRWRRLIGGSCGDSFGSALAGVGGNNSYGRVRRGSRSWKTPHSVRVRNATDGVVLRCASIRRAGRRSTTGRVRASSARPRSLLLAGGHW